MKGGLGLTATYDLTAGGGVDLGWSEPCQYEKCATALVRPYPCQNRLMKIKRF